MFLEYCDFVLIHKDYRTMTFSYILGVLLFLVRSTATSTDSSPLVGCPSSCYCDENGEFVSCEGDGLWRFPSDIPNSTLRLELRNYFAKKVSPDDFATLTSLQELKLQQSHIEIIQNGSFAENNNLQRLDLSQNILTGLSSSVFSSLPRLRHLDISSNLISNVEQAFVGLDSLEQLNLRDNMLQQLTSNTFLGLHKVQYLNLDTNNISLIEVGTFQYLTNLAHLIISNNPLTSLSRLDFFGSRLEFIDISHVGLNIIPQSLTKFVRDLRLAKNNVTHISAGDFDSYPYLGLLVLDDNCVTEIENDALGRQEYLRRLWLNGNCLTSVPPNLPPSLLALYMEENKLNDLERYSFKGLVLLEQLFLQRNEIKHIDSCAFCDLSSLKSLDLQANQIENLTYGMFNNLTQLQTLDLSQNNLKFIDYRCFEGLLYLRTLQMSRVHTTVQLSDSTFDPLHSLLTLEVYDSSDLVQKILNSTRMLHGLRKVEELNLMHNNIVQLRPDFPSFFPALRVIKLSGNAWHCDDNIQWLSTWIKQSNVQFYSSYNVRCATPKSLLFRPLMMLVPSDFYATSEVVSTADILTTQLSTQYSSFTESSTATKNTSPTTSEEVQTETANSLPTDAVNVQEKIPAAHAYYYDIITKSNTKAPIFTSGISTASTEALKPKYESENTTNSGQNSTTELSETTQVIEDEKQGHNVSSVNASIADESLCPQRLVLSSTVKAKKAYTAVIGLSILTIAFVVFIIVSSNAKGSKKYKPISDASVRRSSSISYYPQKGEVSIETQKKGPFRVKSPSHNEEGNKLYYITENCGSSTDGATDTVLDSQFQELLPRSPKDKVFVY